MDRNINALMLGRRLPCFSRKFKKANRTGGQGAGGRIGHCNTCVLPESTFAGPTIIPFFIFMGVFNQWIHRYLKRRSNCRCNCSATALTTVRIQTKTHCEWPKVPRYPLHQQTCSGSPLGIPWRRPTRHQAQPGKVCHAPPCLFYRKFKPDQLTWRCL